LKVKEHIFSKEKLVTELKRLKNNKAQGADSVVNEFFNYGGLKVGVKLSKIVDKIFEKRGCTW